MRDKDTRCVNIVNEEKSQRTVLNDEISSVNNKLNELSIRKRTDLLLLVGVVVLIIVVSGITFFISDDWFNQLIMISTIVAVVFIVCMQFITFINTDQERMRLESRHKELRESLELLEIEEKQYEKRAEIHFQNSQKEVKRYYDTNLSHLRWVFPLGIGTIVLGVVVIIISIVVFGDATSESIVPVALGISSGVFLDFIGAIFIKMYVETIKASTAFHNKLIHSNNNLFANVLITKISDEKLKNETLAEMAKLITSSGLKQSEHSKIAEK